MTTIKELTVMAYDHAIQAGFHIKPRTFGDEIALLHSEASEALEEYRNGHDPNEIYFNTNNPSKPEGVPTELADLVIRVMDMCGYYDIDLEAVIIQKMAYNKTRGYKHGNKVI